MCIITTLDRVLDDIQAGKKTLVTKYDFSNAFGTINHTVLISVLRQLNLSDSVLNYFCEYLENQKMAKTVISDKSGIYTSDFVPMEKGTVQGQIGSDLCFIIQQLCLKPLDEVFRTLYVDDLNDVISAVTEFAAISTAIANERVLVSQSLQVCFKINDDKTTYIPFNIDDSFLKLAKLKITRKTEVLGFPFLAGSCGPDVSPAADMIIERLLEKSRIVHACRAYFDDPLTRVMIARQIIYHCIGEIHLVYAYDKTGAVFNKIRVKVNSVLRATGLTNKTPTTTLDKVLGTNLQKFAEHCIISTGLKLYRDVPNLFGRLGDIRKRFQTDGTYFQKFIDIWNDLEARHRRSLLKCKNNDAVKAYLKKLRSLEYDRKIHSDWRWFDYKKTLNAE